MPGLDPENGCYVLRIAYAGPSEVGKTTTVRSLGELLGGKVHSPKEVRGRTLYFDWLEYQGGRFGGRPLLSRVISVPGQRALRPRRERLLRKADSVVFVTDSTAEGCQTALPMLEELRPWIEDSDPPIGFLVQANKRDLPGALPMEEIRSRLGLPASIPVTSTIAHRADGVRESFVLAIRLALERLAQMAQNGQLDSYDPGEDDPTKLLAELQSIELAADTKLDLSLPAPQPAASLVVDKAPTAGEAIPTLPDALLPVGHIWPPVEGRTYLLEAAREEPSLRLEEKASWCAREGNWCYHSPLPALFSEREEGRKSLLNWARWHALHAGLLSPVRALALAPGEHPEHWRLWQVIHEELPFERALDRAAREHSLHRANALSRDLRRWEDAAKNGEESTRLLVQTGMESLAVRDGRVCFGAIVPWMNLDGGPRIAPP